MSDTPVLITPERLDRILRAGLSVYWGRNERAAMRSGMGDAAGLCDAMADELLAQHKHKRPSKAVLDMAAMFRRVGDEIMRMRERVEVPR